MRPYIDRAYGTEGYRIGFNLPGNDKLHEMPTQICAHCEARVVLNPLRKRTRGHCRRCDAYVCDDCVVMQRCVR